MAYLKIISRIIGSMLLVITLGLGVLDISASVAQQGLFFTPFGLTWRNWSPSTLQQTEFGVQQYLSPDIWFNVFVPILKSPSVLVFGVVAILLLVFGFSKVRKKRSRNRVRR